MSFGYLDASKPQHTSCTRKLEVENRTIFPLVYKVTPTLRYQDDKDTGAVTMTVSPSTIVVHPFGKAQVNVKLTVDGTKLRNNLMNSGSRGNAIGPSDRQRVRRLRRVPGTPSQGDDAVAHPAA